MVTIEQKALLISLTERWINELEDNLANLEINMPKELQSMMKEKINEALVLAKETLEEISES